MRRRAFLSSVVAGSGYVAGCLTAPASRPSNRAGEREDEAWFPSSIASLGVPGEICSEPSKRDPGIYAVTEPAFGSDWSGLEVDDRYRDDDTPGLSPTQPVIGLHVEGSARAYPLSILWWHEVVNDTFAGPVLVTYCPLCRSGMVADRRVDGQVTTFAVTGLLWKPPREFGASSGVKGRIFGVADHPDDPDEIRHNGNLVMYDDATRSYWSQMLAGAICGPATGTALSIRPSTQTTWGEWRTTYPETEVLLPPPHSGVTERNPAFAPAEN